MYTLPNAKINIGLNVVSRRPDGYHDLQTVFYPIPLTDSLELKDGSKWDDDCVLVLSGLKVEGRKEDNLVFRVFASLQKEFHLPPTIIFLSKHIPTGAGLGGGSSDAAFTMMMANEKFRLGLTEGEMEERLSAFGSDCPFFVRNKPVYAEGTGNIFSEISVDLKGWFFVLVKPPISVSTRQAYDGIHPTLPAISLMDMLATTPVSGWRDNIHNDFEPSVFLAHPKIAAIKSTLYDMGATYASMSGSGSAVYGLFPFPVENAQAVFPESFIFTCKL